MKCREARIEFSVLDKSRRLSPGAKGVTPGGREDLIERHISECPACEREYRIFSLGRTVMELTGSSQPIIPDKEWFVAVKAATARLSDSRRFRVLTEESWPGLVWLTAKQLIPIMAAVVVIILGASLFWRNSPIPQDRSGVMVNDRFVLSGQVYEYPQPTRDDVIETLVAVEDQKNGK